MKARRPKILLVAHHCNPEWTSEPLSGWKWARELDRRVDLHVITHVRNREAIERAGTLNGTVYYVDTEKTANRINALNDRLWPKAATVNRLMLDAFALRAFDREAYKVARRLVAAGEVELIHRVSPISHETSPPRMTHTAARCSFSTSGPRV